MIRQSSSLEERPIVHSALSIGLRLTLDGGRMSIAEGGIPSIDANGSDGLENGVTAVIPK